MKHTIKTETLETQVTCIEGDLKGYAAVGNGGEVYAVL